MDRRDIVAGGIGAVLAIPGSTRAMSILDMSDPGPANASIADSSDIVHSRLLGVVRSRQLNPLRAARLFAGVRTAQAEALRLVDREDQRVALWAGLLAMSWMLPQESAASWIGPGLKTLASDPLSSATADRIQAAIIPVLQHLAADRSDARRVALKKPPPVPGFWQRTPPMFAEQPVEPQAPGWQPWCGASAAVTVPEAPRPGSETWRADVEEVWATARTLTPAQKAIAHRWHLDAGSITPPGVWNLLVVEEARRVRASIWQTVRTLALLNMAMQDALVAAWRIKLRDWGERPYTAVRREKDAAFVPELSTPPFPGYVSGHAAASGAAASVLARCLPDRQQAWLELAREAAHSRLLGGIHFTADNAFGLQLGAEVGGAVLAQFGHLQPLPLVKATGDTPSRFFVLPHMSLLHP